MKADLLDRFGVLAATDKSSLRWDYLRHYQEFFRDWRDTEFNLIEIGVAGGNSMLMWRRFFSQATIVGIDIEEGARRCAGDRMEIEIGSQADPAFLAAVCNKYPPGIVIDDGSHQADHIMASFQAVFPLLAPGGWYVIEDLSITGSLDKVPVTPHAYFTQSAMSLLNRRPGDHPDLAALNEIDRIDCAPGIVFVRKKDSKLRHRQAVELIDIVEWTKNANNNLWLGEKLMEDPACLEQAESAAWRAAELFPAAPIYHIGLSRVRLRRGDIPGAIEAANAAAKADPENFESHYQIAAALLQSGDQAAAEAALGRSIAVAPAELRVHIENRFRNLLEKSR
jgi:tetratricopeptide (TPR) repeat protein